MIQNQRCKSIAQRQVDLMNAILIKLHITRNFLFQLLILNCLLILALTLSNLAYSADGGDGSQASKQSTSPQDQDKNNRISLGDGVGKANIPMERSLTGFDNVNETLSLWELGVGGGAFYNPKYPASSEGRVFGLVIPFVVYRGETFRIGDGGGARAIIIENDTFEVDFSFGAALPSDGEDNTARVGMPELDFLGEIGPQMIFMLGKYDFDKNAIGENVGTNIGKGRLDFRLQARAVFSTDFSKIEGRGFIFEPQISYQHRGFKHEETAFNISFGAIFATEKTHDYFYEVAPEFATQARSAYDAKAGYLGSELSLGVSFKVSENIRAFIGGSAQFHSLAANKDSPLFEKTITYSIGTAFVWRFYKSEAKAKW
ncbi:MAG: outer membrane protein [Glaciecola sp.]|jgi:outer membrane scaffolding protein for murein synthesis (MipA/OmpV family)